MAWDASDPDLELGPADINLLTIMIATYKACHIFVQDLHHTCYPEFLVLGARS